MPAYSFKDVSASISGPGGTFSIVSSGDGVSEEGILIESVRQRSTMTVGVDGGVVHNLLAGEPAKCTITLLKTSPINNQLQTLYNTQTATAASHGQNVIIVRDSTRGDVETLLNCAFTSSPSSNFRTEAGTIQWVWDVGFRTTVRGTGTAAAE